jgi:hypothetical protein
MCYTLLPPPKSQKEVAYATEIPEDSAPILPSLPKLSSLRELCRNEALIGAPPIAVYPPEESLENWEAEPVREVTLHIGMGCRL